MRIMKEICTLRTGCRWSGEDDVEEEEEVDAIRFFRRIGVVKFESLFSTFMLSLLGVGMFEVCVMSRNIRLIRRGVDGDDDDEEEEDDDEVVVNDELMIGDDVWTRRSTLTALTSCMRSSSEEIVDESVVV